MVNDHDAPGDLAGRRAIVTGGARGIGEAAIRAFARAGMQVVSFDVVDEAGMAVADAATHSGPGSVSYRHVDVARRDEVFAGVEWAIDRLGALDAVLNVAAIERRAPVEEMDEDEYDAIMAINVKGTVQMCQASFPHLRDHGGAIVNFGSGAALKPYPLGAHYSASKGAVMAFTRTLAMEWGRFGIRANSVAPAIWTPMYDEYRSRLTVDQLAAHDARKAAEIPLGGRLGDPANDLVPVLMFLVSDASRFVTGQIIAVNGGSDMVR